MSDLNVCTFSGRLGFDPDLRHTQSGKSICTMKLAVSDKYNGEETTLWLKVKVWGAMAEPCAQYLYKGKKISVSGKLSLETWTANDGTEKYDITLTAFSVDFGEKVQKPNQAAKQEEYPL